MGDMIKGNEAIAEAASLLLTLSGFVTGAFATIVPPPPP